MKQIYAVWDKTAQEIVGGLMAFSHDAPVIRVMTDGFADPATLLNKHPEDFELVCLGEVHTDDGYPVIDATAFGRPRVVFSGAAWKAMQEAQDKQFEAVK